MPTTTTLPFLCVAMLLLAGGAAAIGVDAPAVATARGAPGFVHVASDGANFTLVRDGRPYRIQGAGGAANLDLLAASGADSVRTWGSDAVPRILPDCHRLGLTICVGFWLSHNPGDYADPGYLARVQQEIETTVTTYRNDPAILVWAIGNETNTAADTPECWRFIGDMARLCHRLDPDHPTMTVLAHPGPATMDRMVQFAPGIDILGVNSYGGLTHWPRLLDQTRYQGPYIVTEFGPDGQWEVARTDWGKPLEQTSTEKAQAYGDRYRFIAAQKARCLGSYAFLWGQKCEETPTWFSMFVERAANLGLAGEACATVDAMAQCWSGKRPRNLAPVLEAVGIDGAAARQARFVAPERFTVAVKATDPDGDPLSYVYEVLKDDGQGRDDGGGAQERPGRVDGVVRADRTTATVSGVAPGDYRLYVYVLDGKGHAATANIPFRVDGDAQAAGSATVVAVAGPPAEAAQAVSRPASPPAPAPAAPRPAPVATADGLASWDRTLFAALGQHLDRHQAPSFLYQAIRQPVRIDSVSGTQLNCVIGLDGAFQIEWKQLTLADRWNLAETLLGAGDRFAPPANALAAFYAFASEHLDAGQRHLTYSGPFAEQVRGSFTDPAALSTGGGDGGGGTAEAKSDGH
jgi:hypothetical protein